MAMASAEARQLLAKKPKAAQIPSRAWFYMILLSVQYGAQALLSKRFTR
jgi:hypothetical protein